MRGKQIAVGLAAVGLMLGGCSDDKPAVQGSEALAQLSGDEMCGLLPVRDVKRAFDAKVEPVGHSLKPPGIFVSCGYAVDLEPDGTETEPMNVETRVSVARGETGTVDSAFTDDLGKSVEHQRVDGLGAAAGFGPDWPVGDESGDKLVVQFTVGGERYQLKVAAHPEASLKRLRPLAEKLLAGLQKQLS